MRILKVAVGLPRSGKSTWARAQGFPIVNPDAIRLAIHGQRFNANAENFVWATAYAMAEALFLAGHDVVVVDATNISKKRREPWQALANKVGAAVELKVFDTTPDECKRRARLSNQEDLIPVIDKMWKEWDLTLDETKKTA